MGSRSSSRSTQQTANSSTSLGIGGDNSGIVGDKNLIATNNSTNDYSQTDNSSVSLDASNSSTNDYSQTDNSSVSLDASNSSRTNSSTNDYSQTDSSTNDYSQTDSSTTNVNNSDNSQNLNGQMSGNSGSINITDGGAFNVAQSAIDSMQTVAQQASSNSLDTLSFAESIAQGNTNFSANVINDTGNLLVQNNANTLDSIKIIANEAGNLTNDLASNSINAISDINKSSLNFADTTSNQALVFSSNSMGLVDKFGTNALNQISNNNGNFMTLGADVLKQVQDTSNQNLNYLSATTDKFAALSNSMLGQTVSSIGASMSSAVDASSSAMERNAKLIQTTNLKGQDLLIGQSKSMTKWLIGGVVASVAVGGLVFFLNGSK